MTFILTAEHALASAAKEIVATARFVCHDVVPALKKLQADETFIESVTALVDPHAVGIERAAFAVLGLVVKALQDAGSVSAAGGVNITLDAQMIADLRAIAPAIKAAAAITAK